MRILLSLFSLILVSACTTTSVFLYPGGQRINLSGVSYVLPPGKNWSVLAQTTFQTFMAAPGKNPNESYVIATTYVKIPSLDSKESYFKMVKQQRAAEPDIGRFELIRNKEILDDTRPETCVRHIAASKDYGSVKKGKEYTIYETYGMNCVHPDNREVSILIELSRKAPPGVPDEEFETIGDQLLRSVEFNNR
jgi:hypothetical protein